MIPELSLDPSAPPAAARPRHAKLGIISFVLSVLTAIVLFGAIVAATIMEMSSPDGMDEDSAGAIIVGLIIIGGILVGILSTALGIAACFQTDRLKIFGILGAVIGGLISLITLALMIVGLAIG